MANEAVIIELLGEPKGCPIELVCADVDAFPKGTIIKLADDRTASLSAAGGDVCGGICAMEKVTLDGSLRVSVYTNGIFDLKESNTGTPAVGTGIIINGANLVTGESAGDAELGKIMGHALASFAKAGTEAVRVLL